MQLYWHFLCLSRARLAARHRICIHMELYYFICFFRPRRASTIAADSAVTVGSARDGRAYEGHRTYDWLYYIL